MQEWDRADPAGDRTSASDRAGLAAAGLLMLQVAACAARIGAFAERAAEPPAQAAAHYRRTARLLEPAAF